MFNVLNTILEIGKSIFEWISDKSNHKTILFIGIILLSIFVFRQCNQITELEQDKQQAQNNIRALNSELVQTEDSLGNVVASKGALQGSYEEIQEYNNTLLDSLEYLNENPITITKLEFVTRSDTLTDIPTVGKYLGEDRFELSWEYENSGNWGARKIGGVNKFTIVGDSSIVEYSTDIVKDVMQMNINTGFTQREDGYLEVFATTNYPGAEFLRVDGAVINPNEYVDQPERQRWGLGVHVGYGFNQKFQTTPYIGVGLSYNFIQF